MWKRVDEFEVDRLVLGLVFAPGLPIGGIDFGDFFIARNGFDSFVLGLVFFVGFIVEKDRNWRLPFRGMALFHLILWFGGSCFEILCLSGFSLAKELYWLSSQKRRHS